MIKPNFEAWTRESLVRFCKESHAALLVEKLEHEILKKKYAGASAMLQTLFNQSHGCE